MAAEIIISIAYGISVARTNDQYVATVEHAMEGFARASSIRGQIFDIFPICGYLHDHLFSQLERCLCLPT